jgi:Mini-chromosome maintenance replisome factor
VRLVGMVQDQLDAEFYASSSSSDLQERTPLVISPFPPNSGWVQRAMFDGPSALRDGVGASLRRPTKRTKLNEDGAGDDDLGDATMKEANLNDETAIVHALPASVIAKMYYDHYQALDRQSPKAKLNELVEIVGVWEQYDSGNAGVTIEGGAGSGIASDDGGAFVLGPQPQWSMDTTGVDAEWVAPPHLPHIHVLWYEPRDVDHLAAVGAAASAREVSTSNVSTNGDSSAWCGALLSRALSVQDTCGQAIWMTLLSMAERKAVPIDDSKDAVLWTPVETPHETTLGCASLNLVLPNAGSCSAVQARLEKILTEVAPHVESLTLDPRNMAGLLPAKKIGRMLSSPLQLPKGTVLILNVSAAAGIKAVNSSPVWEGMQQLTSHHQLVYTFEGIPLAFEADVRILVLSTPTSQHVLPCTMLCRNIDRMDDGPSDSNAVGREDLIALRCALSRARSGALTPTTSCGCGAYGGSRQPLSTCVTNIGFALQVLDRAQNDFMQRRQQARKDIKPLPNETDFHRWLTLTRLQARGRCAAMAEVGDWERALALDDEMRKSLQG